MERQSIGSTDGDQGLVQIHSVHSVATTISRLQAIVERHGLTILARIDHSDAAARAGMELRPTHLLVFGNAKSGTPLMVAAPTIAIDLPLKALIWQDDDGTVWLSYNSPAYLVRRHHVPDVLVGNIAGIEALCEEAARADTTSD
jgi:uncharacterized protein (DUF302 family)